MKRGSEIVISQSGVDILVEYEYERFRTDDIPSAVICGTRLTAVELIIKDRWIDILPLLHEEEREFFVDQLTYES